MYQLLFAALGGYFIGDALKNKKVFADGGVMEDGGSIAELHSKVLNYLAKHKFNISAFGKGGNSIKIEDRDFRIEDQIEIEKMSPKILVSGSSNSDTWYIFMPEKYAEGGMMNDTGMMANGGEIRYKLKGNNFGQQIESGQKFKSLISKTFENQSGENIYPENFIKEIAYTGKIVKSDGSNYLKDYSYKGTLTKFKFLDNKDFLESLKYLDRPSIKSLKFEQGGVMMAHGGNIDMELADFDLDNLDDFETFQFNHFLPSLGKAGALQILINNVEGDYSQLSPELAELAERQDREGEFAKGGMMAKGGRTSMYKKGDVVTTKEILFESGKYAGEIQYPSVTGKVIEIQQSQNDWLYTLDVSDKNDRRIHIVTEAQIKK